MEFIRDFTKISLRESKHNNSSKNKKYNRGNAFNFAEAYR